jgi:hypothetical protein
MQLIRVAVRIRAQDGNSGGRGEIAFARPSFWRRMRKAGVLFLVGLGCGALLLPIPLIHLFGIFFFLAMCGLAARRLVSRKVLKEAHGECPSCHAEGSYFVGMGGRRLAFPIKTSCPACHVGLELDPAAAGASVS